MSRRSESLRIASIPGSRCCAAAPMHCGSRDLRRACCVGHLIRYAVWQLAVAAAILLIPAVAFADNVRADEPVARVRVAFDADRIVDTQALGWADRARGRKISADDPVRIASISKLVTAIGVMRLVEQGKLDLDADVSKLLGWHLRHPRWPNEPISLRLLLSHQSSLTDAAGYYQIPLDGSLQDITDDPRAWDDAHKPGTFFRYANLNFPLVASLMERASGERFDKLMQRLVLQPLAIDSCFNWESCSVATASRAVVLYDADGTAVRDDNQGSKPDCSVNRSSKGDCDLGQWWPGRNGALFSPQGGLRISANGLARIGHLLLGKGVVDGKRVLSTASVRELIGPAWNYSGTNGISFEEDDSGQGRKGFFCRYGLAVQTLATRRPGCRDDPFGDGIERFGHAGSAYGMLAGLWLDARSGRGVAYFATGVPDAPAGRHSAFTEVEEYLSGGNAPPQ